MNLDVSIKQYGTSASTAIGQITTVLINITTQNTVPVDGDLRIKFPKLNPDAPVNQQKSMLSSNYLCSTYPQGTQFSCLFQQDTLKIPFSSGLAQNSQYLFILSGLTNPLNFSPVLLNFSTTLLCSPIDTSQASFSAQTPTQIQLPIDVTPDITTVQEYATYSLLFTTPIPLSAGSSVTVVFPKDDYNFDSRLNIITGYGIFGSLSVLNYQIDQYGRSIKIVNSITTYRQQGLTVQLTLTEIQNPKTTKPTGSFKIYISEPSGKNIALIENGVSISMTAGDMFFVQSSATILNINALTDITLTFSATHQLSSQSSSIKITIPNLLETSSKSTVLPVSGFSPLTFTSSVSGQTFTLTNLFSQTYSGGKQSLTVKLQNILNCGSALTVTGLTLQTLDNNGNVVDRYINTSVPLYTLQPNQFFLQQVTASSNETYSSAIINVKVQIADPIGPNAKIQVKIPNEMAVIGNTVQCIGQQNIKIGNIQCQLGTNAGKQTIIITDGYSQSTGLNIGSIIEFQIQNVLTPMSTQTSSSFQVFTMDANSNIINQAIDMIPITMQQGSQILAIQVSSNSNNVGAQAILTIKFNTRVPIKSGDQLFVMFPPEVTPPNKQNLQCTGNDVSLLTKVQNCQVYGNIVFITLSTAQAQGILSQNSISINIQQIINPSSMAITGNFQVQIKDQSGYLKAQSIDNNGGSFSVGNPGVITDANITALDPRQMAVTTITISFRTITMIPQGGFLQFEFDNIYFVFPSDKSQVSCSTNLVQKANCTFLKEYRILVSGLFPQTLLAGTFLSITIDNCQLQVKSKMTTNSWKIFTLTSDGYPIDKLTTGLSLSFPCNYPCQSCPSNSPSICQQCNQLSNQPILYQQRCYSQCPLGLFLNELNQCQQCDPKCKTCKSDNHQACLSCFWNSTYPYLEGATCSQQCSYGSFANNKTFQCNQCTSPCDSCFGNQTNQCLTCKQNSTMSYFQDNQCLNQCQPGYTPQIGKQCLKCSPNCLECQNKPDYCTKCAQNMIISKLDNTCVFQCPIGTSVYDTVSQTCLACSSNCATCRGLTKFCQSCPSGLKLQQSTGECLGDCGSSGKFVLVNGICSPCNSNCQTCINSPFSCLTCNSPFKLNNFTCVTECPDGYDIQTGQNQCIIKGLVCQFGYEVNPQGNGCILKSQICNEGYQLSVNKDKCVPLPGLYIPFPMIVSIVICSLFVLYSKIKYKETLIVSNIICILSFFESVGILVQTIEAFQLGVNSTFGLSILSAFFLYGSNIFFTLVYRKYSKFDRTFKFWKHKHIKTFKIALVLGSALNFKLYRLFYGRLFGKSRFNVIFDDAGLFFRPFTLISIFSLISTSLPLFVAEICGLVFIQWGYQFTMTCVEMLMIEVSLLVLIIYEKYYLINNEKLTSYYKVEPKTHDNQKFMIANDSQGPTLSGNTCLTRCDILDDHLERKKQLESLITLLSQNNNIKQFNYIDDSTLQDIQMLQQDEKNRLIKRGTKSCCSDVQDFDADIPNFISEPVSPREKEMLHNHRFMGDLRDFRRNVRERDQFDNVYAEQRQQNFIYFPDEDLVDQTTQTDLIELLGVDNIDELKQLYQQKYAQTILNNSDSSPLIQLHPNRVKCIPKFNIEDIRGAFNKDYVLNEDFLQDLNGREVNIKGYLIDKQGNIIDKNGQVIFRSDEISPNGEIPEPFYTLMGVKNLPKLSIKGQRSKVNSSLKELDDILTFNNILDGKEDLESRLEEPPNIFSLDNNKDSFMSQILQPIRAISRQEYRQKKINGNHNLSTLSVQGRTQSRQRPTLISPSSFNHPLNIQSIGIFDTSQNLNETRDNFRTGNSNFNDHLSQSRRIFELDIDKTQKLNHIKGLLSIQNDQDAAIIREIEIYEKAIQDSYAGTTSLAKRSLAKVYGMTQVKKTLLKPQKKIETIENIYNMKQKNSDEHVVSDKQKPPKNPNQNILSGIDVRKKNLENIYAKQIQRPTSQALNISGSSRLAHTGNRTQSAWDFPSTATDSVSKFRPLMNASLYDPQYQQSNFQAQEDSSAINNDDIVKRKRNKKAKTSKKANVLQGGWI